MDGCIQAFPLSIVSYLEGPLFSVEPFDAGTEPDSWSKPASYDQEHATPYSYSVRFDDSFITTEFVPAHRAGHYRFGFPSGNAGVLLGNRNDGKLNVGGPTVLTGSESFKGLTVYFYGEFDRAVTFQPRASGISISNPPTKECAKFAGGHSSSLDGWPQRSARRLLQRTRIFPRAGSR